MPTDQVTDAPTSRAARSAVTNGKRPLLFGDGRSPGQRRKRDLRAQISEEFGGYKNLPTKGQGKVDTLVRIKFELEVLEAERASGKVIDRAHVIALLNAQRRAEQDLEAYNPEATGTSESLEDHLSRTYREGAE